MWPLFVDLYIYNYQNFSNANHCSLLWSRRLCWVIYTFFVAVLILIFHPRLPLLLLAPPLFFILSFFLPSSLPSSFPSSSLYCISCSSLKFFGFARRVSISRSKNDFSKVVSTTYVTLIWNEILSQRWCVAGDAWAYVVTLSSITPLFETVHWNWQFWFWSISSLHIS